MARITRPALLGLCLAATAIAAHASAPDPATLAKVQQKLATMSVPFVPNAGQWDSRAAFAAQTFAGTLFVTKQGELVYSLPGKPIDVGADSAALDNRATPSRRLQPTVGADSAALPAREPSDAKSSPTSRGPGWVLSETLVDAKGQPRSMSQSTLKAPAGYRPMEGKVSYAIGSDTSKHADNVNTYERVNLGDMYPGVNVQLRATGNNVEKIFTVAPKHDPKQISIALRGAEKLEISSQGELIAHTGNGPVAFTAPIAFQETASGERTPVTVNYALDADRQRYGFTLGSYDRSQPLIIDPLLQSTYMGGTGSDYATSLAIHPGNGEIYLAGYTTSTDLPGLDALSGGVATGAQNTHSGGADAFVTRFNASLTQRLQSSYLGGVGVDIAYALAIHPASGDVYIVGVTDSVDLPSVVIDSGAIATGAQSVKSLGYDAFITRFNAALTQRLQSSFLGGSGRDFGQGVAIHPSSGDVYITGFTSSSDLPSTTTATGGLTDGAQSVKSSGDDAFVTRFNDRLTERLQSTYIGGLGTDRASAITIHPVSGEIYIAGFTGSTGLPGTTPANGGVSTGAQSVKSGTFDAFVSRLSVNLNQCLQTTYFGGTHGADATAIAIHPISGEVYIAGSTGSSDLPSVTVASGGVGNGAQASSGSLEDAFVARFNATLTQRPQSTYLGGSGYDAVNALAIHSASGDVYVAGATKSTNLPGITAASGGVAAGSVSVSFGGYDAFVTRFNSTLTRHGQSTYLGGSGDDNAFALAIHPGTGEVYVAGNTDATLTSFSGVSGGAQGSSGGGVDAFVSRISYDLAVVAPACGLDVDGNGGAPNAANDGVILLRAMFGYSGTAVTDGALDGAATRGNWPSIRHYLNNSCGSNFAPVVRPAFVGTACELDLDGSGGAPNAVSDGLMLIRAMLGFTGTAVTTGAIIGSPPRNTWALIRDYLNQNCGTNFAP
ncbi:MAG: hypothetical protein EAZ43_15110 [Betaproteobacteria bacterium]|nr:MAG: hypothetical protein EAZ43_15110 [Betaproteobacteria bacterium]